MAIKHNNFSIEYFSLYIHMYVRVSVCNKTNTSESGIKASSGLWVLVLLDLKTEQHAVRTSIVQINKSKVIAEYQQFLPK